MISRIVAIPVLAAIWLGSPVSALAQDQEPRQAQSRPPETRSEKRDRERAPRGYPRPTPVVYTSPPGYRPPPAHPYAAYYAPRFYAPVYYDRWVYNTYHFSPLRYVPWSLIYGSVGFGNYGYYSFGVNVGYPGYAGPAWYGGGYYPYAYPPYAPYAVAPYGPTTYDIGGVRLQIRPREAEVFVDGYYAGHVDDFDGSFQSLRLAQGPHKLEVRMPGFQSFEIDIHVQPGKTLTINQDLHP